MQKTTALLWAILVFLIAAFPVFTQTPDGFLTGKITEKSTGQPLSGCKVTARDTARRDTSVQSDDIGIFEMPLAPGVYDVEISKTGFAAVARNRIEIVGRRYTLVNAELEIRVSADVEVRSEIFAENAEQTVSNVTLRRQDIQAIPGTGGDPLRAVNSQPAVTAASGEYADLIVRGGTADENLTFIDNIPVYDFTYFSDRYDGNHGGRLGILVPDVIDRAEFSAGGFGTRYGDKMSSVLDIGIREANRKRVQGVFFLDSGSAGGSIDLPVGRRGSWMSSARRSYIDVALDVAGIAEQGQIGYPRTFDFTNKFVYDLNFRNKLSFTAMNFFESFDQTDPQASRMDRRTDRYRMDRSSQRHIFGLTLSTVIGSKTLSQATAWANINHNDGIFFIPFTTQLQRRRILRDSQFGFKEDLSIAVSRKARIMAGGSLYFDRANYFTFENNGAFASPLEEEFSAQPRQNRLRLDTTASGNAYVQAQIFLTPRVSITPGIRFDRYGITGESLVSPRFAARFNVSGRVALTFATGVYRQPPSLFVLSLTPGNRFLKSENATHIIGGIDWLPREDVRFRFEAYRKDYNDLITQRVGATPAFISDGNYFNTGNGHATGFEISVQKSLSGKFTGQASYGFTRSRRKASSTGVEFPFDFERPYQLTLIGMTRIKGFGVAGKLRVASGIPYTNRVPIIPVVGIGFFIQRIATAADVNSRRLPTFANFDVRADRRFGFKKWSFTPYVDIFNVTNHETVVQPNWEFQRKNPQFLSENKRLPIFGLRIEF